MLKVSRRDSRGWLDSLIGARGRWLALFTTLLLASSAVPVLADPSPGVEAFSAPATSGPKVEPIPLPSGQDIANGIAEHEAEETQRLEWLASPEAVSQREVSRTAYAALSAAESQELLNARFSERLDDLNSDPARFLSDAKLELSLGDSAAAVTSDGNTTLMDGTVPVRAPDDEGDLSKVDLSLEASSEGFEPVNPVVDLSIPPRADERMELADGDLAIRQVGADQSSSALPFGDKNVFYPEVAQSTDLLVAPTSAGVELFNQLRSPDSPEELSFDLDLPPGAELIEEAGGARIVTSDGELFANIPPPTALDAQGTSVPVELQASGDSISLQVPHIDEDYAYPILVDPPVNVIEDWANNSWYAGWSQQSLEALTNGAWKYTTNNSHIYGNTTCVRSCWGSGRGLYVSADNSFFGPNQYGHWAYSVPNAGSYISSAWITAFFRQNYNCGWSVQPHDYDGLWTSAGTWNPLQTEKSLTGEAGVVGDGQAFIIGLSTGPPGVWIQCWREIVAGGVALWLDDYQQPVLTTSSSGQWMDNQPLRLNVSATDGGLGVRKFEAEATNKSGAIQKWETWHPCTGTYTSRCPWAWNLSEPSQPQMAYDPSVLPEGINTLSVTAYDAVLRKSTTTNGMTVRVDHAAPEIALSGTLTEQATLGTERPKYTIRADAKDGVPGSVKPEDARAGVTSIVFKNDGQVVGEYKPGCPTQSCSAYQELDVPASELSAGSHTLTVTATDALGHIATKQLNYNTTGDKQAPALSTTGLPSESSSTPVGATYWSAFGTPGPGDGLLNRPADVAVGPNGEVWVADKNNHRIQKFDAEGKFQFKFGTKGSGDGQLWAPAALAIDAQGNLWVADSSNRRVQKFNPEGKFLAKFGSQGTGNGQFSGNGSRGIAIDAQGNIWVSDYSNRIQKFNANGEFLKVVGAGQFGASAGLDVGGGKVWVGDMSNNRLSVFSEAGEYLFKVGSAGSGNGQFMQPDAVEVDAQGNVWVGDEGNQRVQQFNQAGEFVAKFGSLGSGKGQFKFAYPFGLTADDKGSLWIADASNHRVQRWLAPTTTLSGHLEPIAATATDGGFGVTSVAVKLTDKSPKTDVLDEATQTCPQGACPLSLNASEINLSERPIGPYVLSVVAEDAAGNVRETSRVLSLDPAPPEITLSGALAEGAGAPLTTASAELEIAASDLDPASGGIKTINVERNGQLVASYPSDCSSDCHEVEASYTFQAKEDGAKRSIQPVASSAEGSVGELKRVSCVTAKDCWAVGRTKYTAAEQAEGKTAAPLLERWDGVEWKAVAIPKPAGATNVFLEGVSCNSTSACLVIGYYSNGSNNYPLAERWDGTKWTASSPALPSGATMGYLYGVSCSSASNCWAYGKTQVSIAELQEGKVATPYLVRWNGSTWQAEAAPKPAGAANVFLEGVSCNSASACLAVGSYSNGSNNYPLAERWDGTKWTASSPALPSGATMGYLYGVSCSSASNCWAYGKTQVSAAEQAEGKVATSYLVRWNGSTWQAQAAPKTPSGSETTLAGIACPSESACTAVGRYSDGYSETLPLAYTWNGSEWRFQPVPTPTEATTASLEGVSCTNANECAMIGYSRIGSGKWAVLAETEVPGQGPHQITVEAVDVQGNSESETIEVDVTGGEPGALECSTKQGSEPAQGVLTPTQAIDVLEGALPSAVAPSEPAIEATTEEEIDPSYSSPSPNLAAMDSLAESETSVTPEGGFTLAETACFTPATLTTAATNATVTNGDVAVFANTAPETDTAIRPTAMGATIVHSLRGPDAPDSFSWNVTVPPSQELIELPSGAVAIVDTGSEVSGGTAQIPPEPEKSPQDLADAEAQLEKGDYQLITASDETSFEVLAVIAQPWVVLAQGGVVPALIEVVPDTETPNEFEVIIRPQETEEEEAELIVEATTSTARNGHCLPGKSPCGQFDANRAAEYAKYWGNEEHKGGHNWTYPDYGSNNCTNFISQTIRKGGMKWIQAFKDVDGAWWYQCDMKNCGLYWNAHDHSDTWSVADMLPRHLWQYGLARIDPVNQPYGWTKGNILAYDWFGQDGIGNFDHIQFVVGTIDPAGSPREPLIANQSSPGHRYGSKRWSRVKEAIEEAEGHDWTRVPLATKHTHANWKEKQHAPQNLYGPSGVFQG